jgi:hypothetical protein
VFEAISDGEQLDIAWGFGGGRGLNRAAKLVTVGLLLATIGQAQSQYSPGEQSEFGAEDQKWDRPVPVPSSVLQILRSAMKASPEELPAEWLLASEIHLSGPNEIDLLVMGVGGLTLPHAAHFWVFRRKRGQHELVLTTGGDSLTVLNRKWKGFREIQVYNNTASTTAGTIYSFDGQRYVVHSQKTNKIR